MTKQPNPMPVTVLLAEDHPEVLNTLHLFLAHLGCTVFVATNGQEAFRIYELNCNDIDIIITDCNMPMWSGLMLTRAVRRLNDEVPILMITGFAESNDLLEAKSNNVDVLYKPVSFQALAASIQAITHA